MNSPPDERNLDGDDLVVMLYGELRRLARHRIAHEPPGQTLQATALVHEVWMRISGDEKRVAWHSQGHFFAAAAEAMRRILIDRARRRQAQRHGGQWTRIDLTEQHFQICIHSPGQMLLLDEALERLQSQDDVAAQLSKLLIFAGLPVARAADELGISRSEAYRQWIFAKAFLLSELGTPE
ncbi:MAG: ECF-type sigma factor [Planctomycetaceae bacterium]